MFAKERRDKISEMIKTKGAVETSKLAALFNVSVETIRKDLIIMEKADKLSRTHGGAVMRGEMKPIHVLSRRREEYGKEKRNLVLKAMEFISEGDIIVIDEGSTAIIFAEVLKEKFSRLTVITYSLDVFDLLCDHKDFSLILCGGFYMKSERAFYGLQTLEMLKNLHFQKAFIFPTAVSIEFGLWDYGNDLLQLQQQLIKSSEQIYILADSSKFEKTALYKLCDMNENFYYITDSGLSEDLRKIYNENNIKLFTGED